MPPMPSPPSSSPSAVEREGETSPALKPSTAVELENLPLLASESEGETRARSDDARWRPVVEKAVLLPPPPPPPARRWPDGPGERNRFDDGW